MKSKLFSFKNSKKNKFKYIFFAVFSLLLITTVNLSLKTEKALAQYIERLPQSCQSLTHLNVKPTGPNNIKEYDFIEFKENYGYIELSEKNSPQISDENKKGLQFLKLFRDNLKCLYDLSQLTSGIGSGIVSSFKINATDLNSLKYSDFKQDIINYEQANGLVPDGVIDVQTSFLMGYQTGKALLATSNIFETDFKRCSTETEGFDDVTPITDNSDQSTQKSLRIVVACLLNDESWHRDKPPKPIYFLKDPSNYKRFNEYKNIIPLLDKDRAGISFMYVVGFLFGLEKGNWETPPFTYKEFASCDTLEFTNENLFLINDGYSSSSNFPRDENVKTASRILLCLNNFVDQIDGLDTPFLEKKDKGIPTISTTVYSEIRDYVYAYQKIDKNKDIFKNIPISLGNGLGSGSGVLDIKTAFVMGTQMGQLNKDLEHQSCKDEVINFESAHTISKDGKGYHYSSNIKDNLNESKFNSYYLRNVIACLREPVFNDKKIPVNFFKNPVDNFWNYNLKLQKYLPEKTTGTKRIGIPLIFHIGKLFGKYGGKVIDKTSTNTTFGIDYCAKYKNLPKLVDRMHSSKDITLTPRNPGVIDWRDITELDIPEECLTDTKLTASLIGKIIRFAELFVGLIAVLMFIYGGFLYITAHGEEQNASKGLKSIYTGAIGIFIILMSRFIVEILVPISEKGIGLDRSKAFTSDVTGNQQIVELTNWLLGFSSLIAISSLIYGGYIWLISGGDENLHTKAVTILRNTLIGFVIIFAAYTIVMVVLGGAGITN